MTLNPTIVSFTQSEKIKSGLIWVCQLAALYESLPAMDQPGAARIITTLFHMVAYEVSLAQRMTGDPRWADVHKHVENASVMIHSGVLEEAPFHLTQALSRVTAIADNAMQSLSEPSRAEGDPPPAASEHP